MRSTIKISLCAGLLLLCPSLVGAAGLGKLSVLSGLGQPLRAEVEIVAVQAGEGDSLLARISTPDAFRQAGVEYSGVMPQVRTNVVKRGERYVVTLTTPAPVEEPYLDVLLELNSASGRLVRQYTFLLDPVGYKMPAPEVTPPVAATPKIEAAKPESKVTEVKPLPAPAPVEAPKAAAAPAKPAAEPKPTKQAAKPVTEAKPVAEAKPASEAKPGETYQVKEGDTLGKIAAALKPADVSLEQMLVALQRANEDAFINKNMNLVRTGRVLRIPDAKELADVKPEEATRVVNTQGREFTEYRNKLAQQVAAAPAPAKPESGQRSSGRVTTAPAEKAPAETPKDQVRLSRADTGKPGTGAAPGASADDIAAREKALREANQRVVELERNVKDLQTVVELKNKQLADLQKQAQQATATAETAKSEAAKAEAAKAEAIKTEAAKTEAARAEAAKAEAARAAEAAKAEAAKAEAAKAAAAKPAEPSKGLEPLKPAEPPKVEATPPEATPVPAEVTPPVAEPKPPKKAPKKPVTTPTPQPVAEPSLIESLTGNPMVLGGIAAIVLLLGGLVLWKRRQSANANNSLIGATTTDSSSVFGTTGGRSVDTGSHSMQTDFSQGALGTIDTDEVDPIAEADVYMAYGRDAQAEEILKEALQKDPTRQAVRVKLLEIYAARKDLKAFETVAGEIYGATSGHGPDWEKAAALGRGIDPNNPMYGQGEAHTAPGSSIPAPMIAPVVIADEPPPFRPAPVEASQPILDLDLGRGSAPASTDLELDTARGEEEVALDLNLGESSRPAHEAETVDFSPSGTFIMDAAAKKAAADMAANATPPSEDLKIDFELPDTQHPDIPASSYSSAPRAEQPASNVIDLDFKVDEPQDVPALDLAGLNLDLEGDGADSHWQEVATKLDLAKAYEEMGDKDGARELLSEVLKEGDNTQQEQARTMMEAMR